MLLLAGALSAAVPIVHIPLNFHYRPNEKVSTDLKVLYSGEIINVIYN